jgi:hypothetical protein
MNADATPITADNSNRIDPMQAAGIQRGYLDP